MIVLSWIDHSTIWHNNNASKPLSCIQRFDRPKGREGKERVRREKGDTKPRPCMEIARNEREKERRRERDNSPLLLFSLSHFSLSSTAVISLSLSLSTVLIQISPLLSSLPLIPLPQPLRTKAINTNEGHTAN